MSYDALRSVAALIPAYMATTVAVCERSSDDNTPTLHIYMEDGVWLSDLPEAAQRLTVVEEGVWSGGLLVSLQEVSK